MPSVSSSCTSVQEASVVAGVSAAALQLLPGPGELDLEVYFALLG